LADYPELKGYSWQDCHRDFIGAGGLFLVSEIAQKMDIKPGMCVLDLCSGNCASSIFLAKHYDVNVVAADIGVDPTRNFARVKQAGLTGKILPVKMDAQNLQFPDEYESWEEKDIEVMVCVDSCDDTWAGLVGVVPMLFFSLRIDHKKGALLTCGPEIMIHFAVYEAIARRVPRDRIFVSLEKNMKCGFGSCGRCQLGPYYVCHDGPVFSYQQVGSFLETEDF
jgi:NAD(P)H-flavin reductase